MVWERSWRLCGFRMGSMFWSADERKHTSSNFFFFFFLKSAFLYLQYTPVILSY